MLDLGGIEERKIRAVRTFKPPPANLRRQLIGLVDHLFAEYPIPTFLCAACLREDSPFDDLRPMYRQWLVAAGQGESFAKTVTVKAFMTGRESRLFLSAPVHNRIDENVWWARMAAVGLPDDAANALIERIFTYFRFDVEDSRLMEAIWFYARNHGQMDRATFTDVTDCLAWKLRGDPKFNMRGRTLASVSRLVKEWHEELRMARRGRMVEWPGLRIREWELDMHGRIWSVIELVSNFDLLGETRAQSHCVYSYAERCASGCSAIFSLRSRPKVASSSDEEVPVSAVTLEVDRSRTIVQTRGFRNRQPTEPERVVIRRWAADRGFYLGA